jgi:hypothetical protein
VAGSVALGPWQGRNVMEGGMAEEAVTSYSQEAKRSDSDPLKTPSAPLPPPRPFLPQFSHLPIALSDLEPIRGLNPRFGQSPHDMPRGVL